MINDSGHMPRPKTELISRQLKHGECRDAEEIWVFVDISTSLKYNKPIS